MRSPRTFPFLVPFLLVALLDACVGERSVAPTPRPTEMISDGSRSGGNPEFFFLPPLVPNPSGHASYSPGEFNGGWRPVVEVCEVNLANLGAGCVGAPVRTYSGAAVTVSLAEEQYQVQLDTKEPWAVGGKTYRATVVLVGKRRVELGFVDITLSADKGAAKNVRYEDVVTLNDGRTLPLKFRIENGASISPDAPAFAEQVVTNSGGIVRTDETGGPGSFVAQFPAGWLPAGFTSVVVTIEQLNVGASNPCTVSVPNLIQTSDCWRVETYPQLPSLAEDVTVAFCPTIPESDAKYDAQSIFKFDAPTTLRELENVVTALIDCDGPGTIGRLPDGFMGRVRHRALALARGVGDFIGPRTAHAIDAGWGGRIARAAEDDLGDGAFSEFFWGVPVQLEIMDGDGQTGTPGGLLPTSLMVRVTGTHEHDGEVIAIPGVTVTFTPAGGGSVTPGSAVTNADGVATAAWTLGTGGPQGVAASVANVGTTTTVNFTATAAAPIISLFHGSTDITGTTQNVTTDFSQLLAIITSGVPGGCTSISSSNTEVISILGNTVTAEGPGTATVTVTCPPATATVTYVVTPAAPLVASIQLRQSATTGPVYDRLSVNALVGAGNTFAAIPLGVAGGPVDVTCTWTPAPGARFSLVSPESGVGNVATIAGNNATGTELDEITVTCGSASRVLYVSIALGNSIGNVDVLNVFRGGPEFESVADEATLFIGFSTTFMAQPLDVTPEPQDLTGIACGFRSTSNLVSVTPVTGLPQRATLASSTTGQSRLFVTCLGVTREIVINYINPIG